MLVFVKIDPTDVALEAGFTIDVGRIGHFGTVDLEIKLRSKAELEKALPLLQASCNNS